MNFRPRAMNVRVAFAFKKKPIVMQAEQITEPQEIETREGTMRGNAGDWKLSGVEGEEWFVANSIFQKTYEPCDAAAKQAWEAAYGKPAV